MRSLWLRPRYSYSAQVFWTQALMLESALMSLDKKWPIRAECTLWKSAEPHADWQMLSLSLTHTHAHTHTVSHPSAQCHINHTSLDANVNMLCLNLIPLCVINLTSNTFSTDLLMSDRQKPVSLISYENISQSSQLEFLSDIPKT